MSIITLVFINSVLLSFIFMSYEYMESIDFYKDRIDLPHKKQLIDEGSSIVAIFIFVGIIGVSLLCVSSRYSFN